MENVIIGTVLALATVATIYWKHGDEGAKVMSIAFSVLLVVEVVILLLRS